MAIFRKAYSVVGALLMLQILAQFYLIAAALFTITRASNNAQDVYAAFQHADSFAGLHALNGYLIGITILVLIALAFGSRHSRRTTGLTALLFLLLVVQVLLANVGIPLVSALHGLNAIALTGLGGALTGRNWAFRGQQAPGPVPPPSAPVGSRSQGPSQ
ncbi:MAG TPA: DUF6220 domain-containing protein [Chloroflexota bacterium]|nr:DUF6220 domain-containing protein [Chloroflexota bacterium]